MEHIVRFSGELLASVVACMVIIIALRWLHDAAKRSGNQAALPLLRMTLAALIARHWLSG